MGARETAYCQALRTLVSWDVQWTFQSLPLKRMFARDVPNCESWEPPFSLLLGDQRGLEVTPTRIKALAKFGRRPVPKDRSRSDQGQGV